MILEWSYNEVNEDCQNVFLDVSCLLRGAEWSWAEALGTGSELKALEDLSLLKSVKGTTHFDGLTEDEDLSVTLGARPVRYIVGLHDLFVALGQSKDKESCNRVRRICSMDGTLPSVLEDSDNVGECEHIQGLVLHGLFKDTLVLPAKKLDAMSKSLRILHLGNCTRVDDEIQYMPKKLQICSLVGACPYKSLEEMNDLRVLHIDIDGPCNIKIDQILPKTLRVLDLSGMDSLKRFHDDAFRNCGHLHTVRIRRCTNLLELPANFDFRSLQELVLHGCKSLLELPEGFHKLLALSDLDLCDCSGLKTLPDAFPQLASLESLDRRGCESLREIPSGFPELVSLRALEIPARVLPSSGIAQLKSLESLVITDCETLTEFPAGIVNLSSLEILKMMQCESLIEIPSGIENLVNLHELVIWGCKSLRVLPSGIGNLPALEYMELGGCENLRQLPIEVGNLLALKDLTLSGCKNLLQLPDSVSQLKNLHTLAVTGSSCMERLPEGIRDLTALQSLDVNDCQKLTELPGGYWWTPSTSF